LIPNAGETLRISGQAEILVDSELCESFALNGKPASSVLSIQVDKVYYQCQKALVRSKLWNPESRTRPEQLPTAGKLAQYFSAQHGTDLDAEAYDEGYSEQLDKSIY
jgi:predicted pyridoxine 5'-phosphate oxidase superfamily flavin-nucleotide-binding protein